VRTFLRQIAISPTIRDTWIGNPEGAVTKGCTGRVFRHHNPNRNYDDYCLAFSTRYGTIEASPLELKKIKEKLKLPAEVRSNDGKTESQAKAVFDEKSKKLIITIYCVICD
jgi:hypothetical protein